ncbi:MAG TPA: 4Fe-4S dicluster domain-containing protein [bacterium]|jgi:molybdopterin-containing oxidoreductase family iron-sulfur binding subunit
MSLDRRDFLKLAGVTSLGVAAFPLKDLLASAALPQEFPLTAKRWGMVINLRKCQQQDGCRKCIDACHATHNVPQIDNVEEEVKWIWKESYHHAFHDQEHEYQADVLRFAPVPVLCNHCDNPPCVRVCPTQATWRRQDGIVMMDWHRCIGCRYCMVGCPYGSRSFNWSDPRQHLAKIQPDFPTRTKGVVEKCTFCEERLARGELPTCVAACSEKAILFGDLEDSHSEVRAALKENFSLRRKEALGTEPQVYYIV